MTIRMKQQKTKCGIRKTIALACVLLFEFSFSSALRAQAVSPEIFELHGGIEVELTELDLLPMLLTEEGITLDHGCTAHAAKLYVTQSGYDFLVLNDIKFSYQPRPTVTIAMKGKKDLPNLKYGNDCLPVIDYYPTYEAYEEMMYSFQDRYPDLCEIIVLETLDSGRKLLMAHIGDDLTEDDLEPDFLYTSTMHGDETAGFPMMLQLIDHLLCNYNTDDKITQLVNEIDIYINPLANPDGTYRNDNSTVAGASRRNANFVDLNRNFPDPEAGPHPDNKPYQDETVAFLKFGEDYGIDMAANFHGGAEVVNYPWDTFQQLPADVNWWRKVCHSYADTCQAHSDIRYMNEFDDGVTNGYDWYEVKGGRQDNTSYVLRGRECTIELSDTKLVGSDKLPTLWEANRRSLIHYMQEAMYGLQGVVIDCETGLPLMAEVLIADHDVDNSSVFSDSTKGDYYRYLAAGEYEVMVVAAGYDTIRRLVTIEDKSVLTWHIELCPSAAVSTTELDDTSIALIRAGHILRINLGASSETQIDLYNLNGRRLRSVTGSASSYTLDIADLSGIYVAHITIDGKTSAQKVFL